MAQLQKTELLEFYKKKRTSVKRSFFFAIYFGYLPHNSLFPIRSNRNDRNTNTSFFFYKIDVC
jgi:hypothetical protein